MQEAPTDKQEPNGDQGQDTKDSVVYHPVYWLGWGMGMGFGGLMTAWGPSWRIWPLLAASLLCVLLAFVMARQIRNAEAQHMANLAPEDE